METVETARQEPKKSGFSGKQTLALVLAGMALTVAVGTFLLWWWLFPASFTPVQLSPAEESQLQGKLARLEQGIMARQPSAEKIPAHQSREPREALQAEAYSEAGASREIALTQREINAMIAHNTNLADKLAVHFSDNLVSLSLRIPLDEDFPLLGGKVLRVKAGAELAFRNNQPVVILRGVSVMGVPVPNAWLGDLKNIDLVETFGAEPGFWHSFAQGIASIQVKDGQLILILQE